MKTIVYTLAFLLCYITKSVSKFKGQLIGDGNILMPQSNSLSLKSQTRLHGRLSNGFDFDFNLLPPSENTYIGKKVKLFSDQFIFIKF